MKKIWILQTIVIISLYSCEFDEGKIRNLKGNWRFAIGDNKEWSTSGYDDSKWDRIYAPSRWERQNYYNYNGYAWYRKSFRLSPHYKNVNLYLYLGKIDDVDEVYVNGKLVGSTGSFPPEYKSASRNFRKYHLPNDILDYRRDNFIAIRVYDHSGYGGIINGDLGIYLSDIFPVDLNLEGDWKFQLKDSLLWKEVNYNDDSWYNISVPGIWEEQGFKDYDGYAWYRKSFDIPDDLKSEKLVLLLGKIDDIDQTYLNGELIGYTGDLDPQYGDIETYDSYREFRGYYIPENMELKDTSNIIAIRVYDGRGRGGLYEGPVGLITQDNYTKYWFHKVKKKRRTRFDD